MRDSLVAIRSQCKKMKIVDSLAREIHLTAHTSLPFAFYLKNGILFLLQSIDAESDDIIFDDSPVLEFNRKVVNKRSVVDSNDDRDVYAHDDGDRWGHIHRNKLSIDSLLDAEPSKKSHGVWRKHHSNGVKPKVNRQRRDYGDDDNEIDADTRREKDQNNVVLDNDEHDDEDEDLDEDDDGPGSGFIYEESTDLYNLKPSRLCM